MIIPFHGAFRSVLQARVEPDAVHEESVGGSHAHAR
jgi:hypothetical protein